MKNYKEFLINLLCDIVASFIMAIGIYCFLEQADIAPGGISGVAIMLKYLFGLPIGIMTLVINIPLILLAWKYLGHTFTKKTLVTLVISSLILDYVVTPFFPQYSGDRLLGSVFGGLFMGAGLAIVFLRGSTTAGTDIISYLLEKKFPHISIGRLLMFIDCIILAASVAVFGNIESGLFGVVALFCQTKAIDGIIYGMDRGHTVTIMSPKNQEIARRILTEMDRGSTFLHGWGAYSGKDTQVLFCVIRAREYHNLKSIVAEIDPNAFLVVQEASQILGEGFKPMEKEL